MSMSDVISSISKSIGAAAPLVAGALGTPLSGMVVSLLCNAFGADSKNPLDLLAKIQSDPDATLKIKTLELNHATELASIASTDYATEVDDRKDARKNSILYKDFLRHFAYLVTAGFFGALFFCLCLFPLMYESESYCSSCWVC